MRKIRVRAIIEHNGKFLFVQHPHHDNDDWALPSGGLEDDETLTDGISRELIEELGVQPDLGRILYIHQFFLADGHESLEFFFEVRNGIDYLSIDISNTSHGQQELVQAAFINTKNKIVLPEFLAHLHEDMEFHEDMESDNFPKFFVLHQPPYNT